MSSFVLRRAKALALEADTLAQAKQWAEAVDRLSAARDLLSLSPIAAGADLPPLLRKLGDLAAKAGDDKLSDESYLEARRLETEQRAGLLQEPPNG
jgi:hypothetical protein